jgi:hypothetical protein
VKSEGRLRRTRATLTNARTAITPIMIPATVPTEIEVFDSILSPADSNVEEEVRKNVDPK